MTTEQKIREAFDRHEEFWDEQCSYQDFRAGYLALLSELEQCDGMHFGTYLYALPEGVTK